MTSAAAVTANRPLAETAARADVGLERLGVRIGLAQGARGWQCCAEMDASFVADWEAAVAESLLRHYGRTDPTTAAAYVLDWYAHIPGRLGGAFFRLARRVPRLEAAALAVHLDPELHHPDGLALLDDRFWCLPGDPAAAHPSASVVPDADALAAVLRQQVRAHADAFLAAYRPGARLPRRALPGAFIDGLDLGVWYGAERGRAAVSSVLADAALVLPGATPEFREPSTLHSLVDGRDLEHLTRRRISCCYHFKVAGVEGACTTCPRTSEAERVRRLTEREDLDLET